MSSSKKLDDKPNGQKSVERLSVAESKSTPPKTSAKTVVKRATNVTNVLDEASVKITTTTATVNGVPSSRAKPITTSMAKAPVKIAVSSLAPSQHSVTSTPVPATVQSSVKALKKGPASAKVTSTATAPAATLAQPSVKAPMKAPASAKVTSTATAPAVTPAQPLVKGAVKGVTKTKTPERAPETEAKGSVVKVIAEAIVTAGMKGLIQGILETPSPSTVKTTSPAETTVDVPATTATSANTPVKTAIKAPETTKATIPATCATKAPGKVRLGNEMNTKQTVEIKVTTGNPVVQTSESLPPVSFGVTNKAKSPAVKNISAVSIPPKNQSKLTAGAIGDRRILSSGNNDDDEREVLVAPKSIRSALPHSMKAANTTKYSELTNHTGNTYSSVKSTFSDNNTLTKNQTNFEHVENTKGMEYKQFSQVLYTEHGQYDENGDVVKQPDFEEAQYHDDGETALELEVENSDGISYNREDIGHTHMEHWEVVSGVEEAEKRDEEGKEDQDEEAVEEESEEAYELQEESDEIYEVEEVAEEVEEVEEVAEEVEEVEEVAEEVEEAAEEIEEETEEADEVEAEAEEIKEDENIVEEAQENAEEIEEIEEAHEEAHEEVHEEAHEEEEEEADEVEEEEEEMEEVE